jgi:radical SAM superfamily enzyme
MNNDQITWAPGVTLDEIEEEVIKRAFRHFQKNKTATAEALGISIRTLDNKLLKYDEDQKKRDQFSEHDEEKRRAELARCRGVLPTVPAETKAEIKETVGFENDPEIQTMKLKTKTRGN